MAVLVPVHHSEEPLPVFFLLFHVGTCCLAAKPSPGHGIQVSCILCEAGERGQLDVLPIKFGIFLVCLVVCALCLWCYRHLCSGFGRVC